MSFNKDYVNKIITPYSATLNVYVTPTSLKTVGGKNNILLTLKKGSPAGRSSGDYFKMSEGDFYVVNLYSPVNNKKFGYVKESDILTTNAPPTASPVADSQANSLLQDLIKNDQALYKSLLINSILLKQAQSKGLKTSSLEKTLNSLITAYNARQDKIKTSNLVKFQTGIVDPTTKATKSFFDKLADQMVKNETSGIGIAPIAVCIIFVAGAATAALIYYAFKPDYETSKTNLKTSKELEKALSALAPAEAKKLTDNLENQIDTAYNQGKTDQSFMGLFGNIKTIAIIGLGGFLAWQIFSKIGKHKK